MQVMSFSAGVNYEFKLETNYSNQPICIFFTLLLAYKGGEKLVNSLEKGL